MQAERLDYVKRKAEIKTVKILCKSECKHISVPKFSV